MRTAVDIQNYLPHRPPMLMVDLILNVDASYVETVFLIKEDNIFVSNDVFIEAGLIENTTNLFCYSREKIFF